MNSKDIWTLREKRELAYDKAHFTSSLAVSIRILHLPDGALQARGKALGERYSPAQHVAQRTDPGGTTIQDAAESAGALTLARSAQRGFHGDFTGRRNLET